MRVSSLGPREWVRVAVVGGVVSVCACALAVLTMPTTFTSISTIDIQSPDQATPSPPATVALGAFDDQNLGLLVERIGLYPSEPESGADVVRRFREDISVTLMAPGAEARVEQIPETTGSERFRNQGSMQIAFRYSDGPKSQEVAAELARLVIEENLQQPSTARYRVTGLPDHVAADSNMALALALGLVAGLLAACGLAMLRGRAVLTPVSK